MFLYDEPTSGLDPVNADNICKLISELSVRDKGFITVTHKVSDAMKISDRFMFLKDGLILFDGGRESLLGAEENDIKIFIGSENI